MRPQNAINFWKKLQVSKVAKWKPSCLKPSKAARKKPTPAATLLSKLVSEIHRTNSKDFVPRGKSMHPKLGWWKILEAWEEIWKFSKIPLLGLFLVSCKHFYIMYIYDILHLLYVCTFFSLRLTCYMACAFWPWPNLTLRHENLDRHSSARFQSLEISRWQGHQTSSPWAGAAALELVLSYSGLPKHHLKGTKNVYFCF